MSQNPAGSADVTSISAPRRAVNSGDRAFYLIAKGIAISVIILALLLVADLAPAQSPPAKDFQQWTNVAVGFGGAGGYLEMNVYKGLVPSTRNLRKFVHPSVMIVTECVML